MGKGLKRKFYQRNYKYDKYKHKNVLNLIIYQKNVK
jgi:hypothetical protein